MTEEAKSTEEGSASVEEPKGLSNRDALEVAIAAVKDKEENERKDTTSNKSSIAADDGRTDASSSEVNESSDASAQTETPSLAPPSEFSKEEKEDFYASSKKAQEAILRLHNKRQRVFSEIQRDKALVSKEKEELKSLKDLSSAMEPYLRAVGVKKPTEVALKEALGMWKEFNDGDPREAAAAYLEAKGIEVPRELLNGKRAEADPEKAALQTRLSQVENVIAANQAQVATQVLGSAWSRFEADKNAAGKPKFPSILGESEEAIRMASNIGSLVRGDTPLSRQFIALARERIPGLDYHGLLTEAYRYLGGQVDDSSQTTRSQDSQKHIVNAGRAASSKPGRGAAVESSGTVKKYKTNREALQAAMQQLNEEA